MNDKRAHVQALQRRYSYLTWLVTRNPQFEDRHGELAEIAALEWLLPTLWKLVDPS